MGARHTHHHAQHQIRHRHRRPAVLRAVMGRDRRHPVHHLGQRHHAAPADVDGPARQHRPGDRRPLGDPDHHHGFGACGAQCYGQAARGALGVGERGLPYPGDSDWNGKPADPLAAERPFHAIMTAANETLYHGVRFGGFNSPKVPPWIKDGFPSRLRFRSASRERSDIFPTHNRPSNC
ncbi:hypothetical protein BQ8482_170067 [Mesorhizobium delmotii]|uniref:Uncharacterized protein n=1 Tax=Mesorhizobium delmotii TaxID=1631247 RepID=A0A2P9AHX1_9HYPH|nr:hypothetical protein BQ8482_170067 [Mesorhizobium delmotii]